MLRLIAVFLFAVSCASAFPVVFLTQGEDAKAATDGHLLDCLPGSEFHSFRCKPTTNTKGLELSELPRFELFDESQNEISAMEEVVVMPKPAALTDSGNFIVTADEVVVSPAGDEEEIVLELDDDRDRYEVDDRDRYEVVTQKPKHKKDKNPHGCAENEVFVSELDICLPYEPSRPDTKPSRKPERPAIEVVEFDRHSHIDPTFEIIEVYHEPTEKCPEGHMFNPSVGICLPLRTFDPKPVTDDEETRIEVVEFDRHSDIDPSFEIVKVYHEPTEKCPKGHMFNPSTGICLPLRTHNSKPITENEKSTIDVVEFDRHSDVDPSFEIVRVYHEPTEECPEGHMFNPSTGICLPLKTLHSRQVSDDDKDDIEVIEFDHSDIDPSFEIVRVFHEPAEICPEGHIFNPSTSTCLPVKIDAKLIRGSEETGIEIIEFDHSEIDPSFEIVKVYHEPPKPCPEGHMFNPSTGICLPFRKHDDDDK